MLQKVAAVAWPINTSSAAYFVLFGQKNPPCGKFNKKDCFGSSLFYVTIIPV